MSDDTFEAAERPELSLKSSVFYVTSWGYAADHLFGWFAKALNTHPEVFALLAHEGSRPKYFGDLTRSERPDLQQFTSFLTDMGMTYEAIGDCYSYRASQFASLKRESKLVDVPVLNLVRDPIVWLEYFVAWRNANMRMPGKGSDPLAWEWSISPHRLFESLDLKSYEKKDIEIWASYLGMSHLNAAVGDVVEGVKQKKVEDIYESDTELSDALSFLTREKCAYDQSTLLQIDGMRRTLFRGETALHTDARQLWENWEGWKCDAFRRIVSPRTMQHYRALGYDLYDLDDEPHFVVGSGPRIERNRQDIFISSMFKSGTWLLRSAVTSLTGLQPYEPEIVEGLPPPDSSDETVILFPAGMYFSWHAQIGTRTASLLRSRRCRCILLVRNIYDVLASAAHHLMYDVDAGLGRSVRSPDYERHKCRVMDPQTTSSEDAITLTISGFHTPYSRWNGIVEQIQLMASLLNFAQSNRDVLLLSYEQLTDRKKDTITAIADFIGVTDDSKILGAISSTDPARMKQEAESVNAGNHVLSPRVARFRQAIDEKHVAMVRLLLATHFPDHRAVCDELNLSGLTSANTLEMDS